jgi:type IX secretion system PorP/SprF family membrane protein
MRSIVTAVLATFLLWTPLRSQDIHFTLFDMVPVIFNPAETGNFYGSFRISGLYRDQWVAVTGFPDEFKTPALSVDAPIIKGFRENDWVGIGAFFYSDKAGSLGLSNTAFKLSAAYHFALNKKGTSVITLGYQTGSVGKRIRAAKWNEVVLESNNFDPGGATTDPILMIDDAENNFIDHVLGLHFKSQGKTTLLQLGFAVANISGADASLFGTAGVIGGPGGPNPNPNRNRRRSPSKFIGTASFRAQTNSRFALHPKAFVQFLGKASEMVFRMEGEYLLNPQKQYVLRGGLGYRLGDAFQLVAGLDVRDQWKFTLGYDINVSRLTPASNAIGGFELSVVYIGKIYKRPDPEPILFCPRF